ncbi:ion channel [Peribacillus deserti]|uniref:Transporter n=1 Tax=Peribacillus deserti TaxID=673318 RepID=A0A2N5MBY4_9BACI|nr:ion channel [Peribacillus deserti]PLT31858.1 transporter [Peribacillus deserti]
MIYYFLIPVIFCMILSLKSLFSPLHMIDRHLTLRNFLWLALLYSTVTIGFGMIYLLLELENYTVLLEMGQHLQGTYFYKLQTAIYFSSITFFSVGYGDLSPVGIGRMIAAVQAFIGYTLPAAFVVRSVFYMEPPDKR